MTIVFTDVETTGLDPIDSAPFEVAMMVYRGGELLIERVFNLNPLSEEVIFHEDAFRVHGVLEETIKTYPPASEVIPQISEFLSAYCPPEKMVFGGYNASFDYGQMGGIMFRHRSMINDYFTGQLIDVLELVRKAKAQGLIKATRDNKLSTITEALGIKHDEAHTALSDIRATRKLYEYIYSLWRKAK